MTRREPYVDQLFREAKVDIPLYLKDLILRISEEPGRAPHMSIKHIPTGILVKKSGDAERALFDPDHLHNMKADLLTELKGKINEVS